METNFSVEKMEQKFNLIDKSSWQEGPWKNEPDFVRFEYLGLTCEVARHAMGHLCGYVKIPSKHYFFGVDKYSKNAIAIKVHGGVSYSKQEKDDWVIGFDTAHLGDLIPGKILEIFQKLVPSLNPNEGATYRDVPYIIEQLQLMCNQIVMN